MRTRDVSMSSRISGRSDADVNMKVSALFGRDTELRGLRTLIERVVDDVQWLDGPTAEVLAFLARRVGGDPIVIISALRRGHAGLFANAGLPELDLLGLDDTSARQVLGVAAGDLSVAERERILQQS